MKQYIIIPLFYFLSLIFLLFSLKMGIRLPTGAIMWQHSASALAIKKAGPILRTGDSATTVQANRHVYEPRRSCKRCLSMSDYSRVSR